MHALVVEDEFLVAWELETLLQHLGFETVEVVSSLERAVAAARRRAPDLVTIEPMRSYGLPPQEVPWSAMGPSCAVVYVTSCPEVLAGVSNAIVVRKPFNSAILKWAVARAQATRPGVAH